MSRMNNRFRRDQRREEAGVRQEQYEELTLEQKIARAESRGGNSEKELIRLHAEIP